MTVSGVVKEKHLIELDAPAPFPVGSTVVVDLEPAPRRGSPKAILAALASSPEAADADVDALEAAIASGELPSGDEEVLESEGP